MHKSTTTRKSASKRQRRGLILLLALGMLALFSLLAVTWVVSASSSRAGAQAMRIRANQSNASVKGMASEVMKLAVRGTRDQKSAFHMHSVLEDIYDVNAIRVRFGHRFFGNNVPAMQERWCRKLTPVDNNPLLYPAELVKLSLDPRNPNTLEGRLDSFQISHFEGAYNGRVLTVLEGPLSGHSFRIVKYIGYVPSQFDNDPDLNVTGSGNVPSGPTNNYSRQDAYHYDYSVVVDLSTVRGKLEGKWRSSATAPVTTFSGELTDWLNLPNSQGIRNLFYFYDPATRSYTGYKCIINGAAFNNAAIGLETDPNQSGFGNIDGRDLLKIPLPGNQNRQKVSPALLPNYDYLQNPIYMQANGFVGVPGVGETSRLKGQSNEGIDVADWRDFWLSYSDSNTHIPSFHRPELIHYLSNLYGQAENPVEAIELIRWLDASTARVLSYGNVNPYFKPTFNSPTLEENDFGDLSLIRSYIKKQIDGPWDVDNDGDGLLDSVWINPNLPAIHSPDGRLLKPLAAIIIRDLDSRLNINLHGDRTQGLAGNAIGNPNGFETYGYAQGLLRANRSVSQGFGYGPADISLNPLFLFSPRPGDANRVYSGLLTSSKTNYSLFDLRYGARPYSQHPFDSLVERPLVDRSPGGPVDDLQSQYMQREVPGGVNPGIFSHRSMPGAPLGRRSGTAPAFDRHGNLTFLTPQVLDTYPERADSIQSTTPAPASEYIGDAYESGTGNRNYGDTPFTLADLEPLLRGFDEDVASLPSDLKNRLFTAGLDSTIKVNNLITTHSAELRYPKLAAAGMVNGQMVKDAGNLIGLIRLVHEQRYRSASEPSIPIETLYELFPPEFASNLRLNLNRPLGNGKNDNEKDNNGNIVDNQIDEPLESFMQQPETAGNGFYLRGINTKNSFSRGLVGSRQLLARYLYCLGQLVIPRNYQFPAMVGVSGQFTKDRLRARAIAQWAVNVVDFRDTDAAMTRFEFDIYPFGISNVTLPGNGTPVTRTAYWAPDKLINPSNNGQQVNANVRPFIDVVWGMEMPELLLTESLAFHDKRLRNTDMDNGGGNKKLYDPTGVNGDDQDLDQYRFPQGSLFLELYTPRSTYVLDDPVLAGAPSSLYTAVNGRMKLDLSRLAPSDSNGDWGSQPVWRIGLSESAPQSDLNSPEKQLMPNVRYQGPNNQNSKLEWLDTQYASKQDLDGFASANNPEVNLGSGLHHDLGSFNTQTIEFERMIWFSQLSASSLPRVPNLKGDSNGGQNQDRAHMVYYNRNLNNLAMDGGSYLVIGPRLETNIGSLTYNPTDGAPWQPNLERNKLISNTPVFSPSRQMISLAGNSVSTTLLDGKTIFDHRPDWLPAVKNPIGLICAADPPDGPKSGPDGNVAWSDCFPRGVGINISMPNPIRNRGYWKTNLMPAWKLNPNDRQENRPDRKFGYNDVPPDSYVDCTAPASQFPNEPFDYDQNINPILTSQSGIMNQTGTYDNVRTAYLQRLADPQIPYDPISNPYITVDWISIDLTVFNGETTKNSDPGDQGNKQIAFQSRYKDGGFNRYDQDGVRPNPGSKYTIANKGQPNLSQIAPKDWGYSYHSSSTARLLETPRQPWLQNWTPDPQDGKFPSYFTCQLGYTSDDVLNNPTIARSSATTLGYLNVGYFGAGKLTDTADDYDGFGPPQLIPLQPDYNGSGRDMTSPVWLNRQFANTHELMLVPLTSPGQFGYYFGFADDTRSRTPFRYLPAFNDANPLVSKMTPGVQDAQSDFARFQGANEAQERTRGYWMRRAGSWDPSPNIRNRMAADWGFLLEFVETPSPYVDTIKRLDPSIINNAYTIDQWHQRFLGSYVPPNYTSQNEGERFIGDTLLEPYNALPTYVSPGKINLNTIPFDGSGNSFIFQGLEYLFLNHQQRNLNQSNLAPIFFANRRGLENPGLLSIWGLSNSNMDPRFPTQFAGAYSSTLTSNVKPWAPQRDPTTERTTISNPSLIRDEGRFPNEVGILRSLRRDDKQKTELIDGLTLGSPLFSPDEVIAQNGQVQVVTPEQREARQNAFTRYQRAMRLSNLTTDQSNVFAMWVTVALFEYDPVTGFGKEYSNSAGEPERERAFYIIDRTVPVGFLPGEDLNSDKAVLLKRTINSKRR